MQRRINVCLSESTARLLDRVVVKGNRSRLIDEAVRYYIQDKGKAELRRKLREGAVKNAERDLAIAQEWFPIESEP